MRKLPKVVRIEPAEKCNLACSHCPTGTIDMVRGLMSKEVFDKILYELKNNLDSVKVIVLYHGGEPLLNKNFFDMCSAIRELSDNLMIKTVTNGMALTPKVASKLISCGLNEVEISLDGMSQNESQEVRIKSDTMKIVKNVKKLIQERDRAESKLTISIATTQFIRSKSALNNPQKTNPTTPEWLTNTFGNSVNYKPCIAMRWPHMEIGEQYELGTAEGGDKDYCDHPINTITVRSNGDVVPCCYDLTSQMVMGNVMHDSLLNIFSNEKYENIRRSIAKKKYISACQNCNQVRPHVYLIKP